MLLQLRDCDPGPTHMCVDCLSRLENWEEFKKKCISSNECIKKYLNEIEEEQLNSTVDNSVKSNVQLVVDEQDHYDSTFNSEINNQESDSDTSRSKLPITITVIQLLLIFN